MNPTLFPMQVFPARQRILPLPLLVAAISLATLTSVPLPGQEADPTVAAAESTGDVGSIVGSIFDRDAGGGLSGARVTVEGSEISSTTGADGQFRLEGVPVGKVSLRVARDGYRMLRVDDVEVIADEPTQIDASMEAGVRSSEPQSTTTDEEIVQLDALEVVSAEMLANSAESFTALRREVSVSVDAISAEELRKFIASDVSEAIIRIPGVSVASRGAFAVIRGLGERYNTTTLNGVVMPSSDPERQSIELDQFPTRLLDGLVVYKNFAPDLPSNLTGGGVEIKTLSFPTKRTISLNLGVGIDAGAFNDEEFLSYRTRGSNDRFAMGSKDRLTVDEAIAIRQQSIDTTGRPILPADPAVPRTATAGTLQAMPRGALTFADSYSFGDGKRLGVMVSGSYESTRETISGRDGGGFVHRVSRDIDGNLQLGFLDVREDGYSFTQSVEKIQMGAFAGLTLRLTDNAQFSLTGFLAQTGIDRAEFHDEMVHTDGTARPYSREAQDNPNIAPWDIADLFRYRLRYRERNLTSAAFDGTLRFPRLSDAQLKWTLSHTTTYQEEPDTRFLFYYQPLNEVQYEIVQGLETIDGTARGWNKVEEKQPAASLTLNLPLRLFRMIGASATLGGSTSKTTRDYTELIEQGFVFPGGASPYVLENPADVAGYMSSIVAPPTAVQVERKISAGFASLDLPLTSRLRLAGGVRVDRIKSESFGFGYIPGGVTSAFFHYTVPDNYGRFFSHIPINSNDPLDPENAAAFSPVFEDTSALPAISLNWRPRSELTLRLGYTETIARPSMRETSNYYTRTDDDQLQMGNALMRQSQIRNLDLRAEWYFAGTDLAAVSLFAKEIDDPIEKIFMDHPAGVNPVESFINNPATAEVRGIEVELRRNLGFLGESWRGLTLGGNATWIDATVPSIVLRNAEGTVVFNEKLYQPEERRLYDQPRWLYNIDATYELVSWRTAFTVAYVASDQVLNAIDQGPTLDQYRDKISRMDCTLRQQFGEHVSVKLSFKNLLDPEYRLIRDTSIVGGSEEIIDRTWKLGRSVSLSVGYEF